jgi:hypothetical protein
MLFDLFRTPPPPIAITPSVKTQIATALRRLTYYDRAYNLNLFNLTPTYIDDLRNDFEVALAHGDLIAVRIELTDANNVVGASFCISFNGPGQDAAPRKDSAALELPVLDRARFTGRRLIVTGIDSPAYRKQLRLSWRSAETYQRAGGTTFSSDFTARSSNGLTQGEFFAANNSTHLMVIVNSSPDGPYAFARSLTLDRDDTIFILKKHAAGVDLTIGKKVSGLVIMTPRGLQARAVKAA